MPQLTRAGYFYQGLAVSCGINLSIVLDVRSKALPYDLDGVSIHSFPDLYVLLVRRPLDSHQLTNTRI